jgi:mannose-6-phosphate isomerase class I
MIENGPYKGMTLDKLWEEYPKLFGNPQEKVFPLLTKILDANMDLSVQVHPDDSYAMVWFYDDFIEKKGGSASSGVNCVIFRTRTASCIYTKGRAS